MNGDNAIRSRLRIVLNLGKDPDLRKLGFSYIGYKITELASWIVILVFAFERGGVIESGIVAAAMLLPAALIVSFASALGDRLPRVRLLALAYAAMALAAASCAGALMLGASHVLVYASMLALCVSISFGQPLQMSTLVSLTDRAEDLAAANVVNGLIDSASYFAGPLLAALLLPWAGPEAVFGVLTLTMAAAAASALGIQSRGPRAAATRATEPEHLFRDLARGLRWVTRESDATVLVGLLAGHELLAGAIDVLFVAIAFDLLGTGDSGAAFLNAAFGLGLIGGALVSLRLVGSRRLGAWSLVGGAVAGLPLLLLAGSTQQSVALVLLGTAGIGARLAETAALTLVQRVIPPYRTSQTFGVLESIGLVAATLGTIGMAALVSLLGATAGLVILGLTSMIVILLAYVPIRALESRYGPPPRRVLEALRGLSIFRPLGVLAIEQLARAAKIVEADAGTRLIRQGDTGRAFYVLLEGVVEASVDSVAVRTQRAGEYFGEISALRGVPRTASIVAQTPVVAIEIEDRLFLQAVSSHAPSLEHVRSIAREREFGS